MTVKDQLEAWVSVPLRGSGDEKDAPHPQDILLHDAFQSPRGESIVKGDQHAGSSTLGSCVSVPSRGIDRESWRNDGWYVVNAPSFSPLAGNRS